MTALGVASLVVALLGAEPTLPAAAYEWPLDLPQVVTSSFGEYRPGRFHTGIDLRTGDTGKPVHAAGDGYIARISCSPWGYGKALYLRLGDNSTVVYGHLEAFAEDIEDYVRREQHEKKSYSVDLSPDPAQFPIKRAQVIAKSGETGVGPAHLHFEIRDALNRPLNPRLLGVTWPDSTPPVIRRVLVMPEGPDSTVNGDIVPVVLDVTAKGAGPYRCAAVRARGRIGFGADVEDPANGGQNTLGVHVLRAYRGERELFRDQHDRVSFDDRDNAAVAYDPFLLGRGHFLLLWRWPGNESEIFGRTKGDGWFDVPDEATDVRIEAVDFLGNTAVVVVPILPAKDDPTPTPTPPNSREATAGRGTVRLECVGTWLTLTASFTAPEPEIPTLFLDGAAPIEGGVFRRVNETTFRAGYVPATSVRQVVFRVQHPRIKPYEKSVLVFQRDDGDRVQPIEDVTLHVRPNSPYGTLYAYADALPQTPKTPLPSFRRPWRIRPEASPISVPVDLAFPMPKGAQDPSRVDVYRATDAGWACESARHAGNRLVVSTQHFGTFVALEDTKPPAISGIRVEDARAASSSRPAITASLSDIGSGIASWQVVCDDQWLLVAYDPERDLLEWERDQDLPAGRRILTFRAADRAGNQTTITHPVTVSARAKKE